MAVGKQMHPFLVDERPLAFAHRGGTESAPENSLAAFSAAVDVGLRYLETDVHLTADGVVVAAHDERLDRVADRNGVIAELDWADVAVARLDGKEPIPCLEELFDAFPTCRFNIDPKSDAVVQPLIDTLVRCDVVDRVCIGAFSETRMAAVRRELPGLCTAASPRETAGAIAAMRLHRGVRSAGDPPAYDCFQVPVRHKGLPVCTAGFVRRAHDNGVQVHVWTVDEPAEMHRLLDMGVDGIMTDLPSVLRSVLEDRGVWH